VTQKAAAEDVALAKAMIEAGKGDDKASFVDFNVHPQPPAYTTAAIYHSWFAADGPAAFPANIAGFDRNARLLWVDGADEVQEKKAGHRSHTRQGDGECPYELLEVRHLEVPGAAIPLSRQAAPG